MNQSDLD